MPQMPSSENQPPAVRVGLYIRVSTAQQDISVEEQELRLRAGVARRPGWAVADIYIDDGYSGHDMNRPEVQRCLQDVAASRLDKVLALALDRAHRNERNRRNFEAYLVERGVEMVYETEPIFGNISTRNLSRGMQGVIAEWWSDATSDRTRDALLHLAKTKRRPGGPIPFGLAIGTEHNYIRDPERYPTLLQIFTRRAQGESVRSIARWLSDTGIPNPGTLHYEQRPTNARGAAKRRPRPGWYRVTVERLLRNEAYHGVLVYNRTYSPRYGRATKSADEVVRIEDAWEHFVPDDLWYQCQLLDLETSGVQVGPQSNNTFALSRLLHCAKCGHSMHGYTSTNYSIVAGQRKRYRYRAYRCTGRANVAVCDAPIIPAERLEALVIGAVCDWLRANAEAIRRLYDESAAQLETYRRDLQEGITEQTARIAAHIAERSRLVQAVAGLVTRNASDELIAQMDIAVQRVSEAIHLDEARRDLARAALQKLPQERLKLDAFRASLDGMAARLQSADLPVKKRILSDILERIDIDPTAHTAAIHVKAIGPQNAMPSHDIISVSV